VPEKTVDSVDILDDNDEKDDNLSNPVLNPDSEEETATKKLDEKDPALDSEELPKVETVPEKIVDSIDEDILDDKDE